jgi:outer membrane cobalamin receptor
MDVSPRFSASYALSDETTLKGSFGYYTQLPVDGPELNPDFGNPNLSSQLALSTVLGVEQKLGKVWFFRVETYNKDLSRVVVSDPVLRYSNAGVGFNRGLELFLRRSPDERLFGWVSCAVSDGERRNGPNQAWHPYDYDQPLIATVVAGYKVTPQWEAGVKFRFSSGQPETPVTGAFYDPVNNRYIALYGPVNSGRLPDYARLDFSTSYTTVYDTWQWKVFLEILNVTNNPNVFGYDYNFDYTDRKELHQFPFLPYLGIEAKY